MIRHFRFPIGRTRLASRASFTLIELLITTLVIAILASMIMFAMQGAMQMAQSARTRAQITKLNSVISSNWVGYEYRRVRVQAQVPTTHPQYGLLVAGTRLDMIRELMRMDLPDRKSDVEDPPVHDFNGDNMLNDNDRSSLSRGYLRRVTAAAGGMANWLPSFQGAECLYMIVAATTDGGRHALEYFNDNEIGDVDEDGMPEILDAWGQPIEFLRWAPGFRSPIQSGNALNDPDPFDPRGLRADFDADGNPDTYALVPLILSAGPDRKYDIVTDVLDPNAGQRVRYSQTNPPNNPYIKAASGSLLGTEEDTGNPLDGEDFHDNIYSHELGTQAQ